MKPAAFAYGAGALLLAASLLCLAARHVVDLRGRKEAEGGRGGAERTTARSVDGADRAPARGRGVAGDSPEEAMARRLRPLLTTSNTADLTRSVLMLIAPFQPEDWPVALEAVRGMGLGNLSPGYRLLLSAWAESDRTAMMAWAEKHGDLSVALADWRQGDPQAAMDWLRAPERNHDAGWNVLMGAAVSPLGKDLPALGRALAGLPDDKVFNIFVQGRMDFNGVDPSELAAWLDTLDPGIQKMAMTGLLISRMSGVQMVALAESRPELVQPKDYQAAYTHWAGENPEVAATELEHAEPGSRFKGLLAGVLGNLTEKGEMDRCLELMRRWPDQVSDEVAEASAHQFQEHPEQASEMVGMIKDPYQRAWGYRYFFKAWFARDDGAARQWLAGHGEVPDAVRQEFDGK